jgi:hypothetical protein
MSLGKGMAIGFLAGLGVAGGAVLLRRDDAVLDRQTARITALEAQVQRLDGTVSRFTDVVAAGAHAPAVAASTPPPREPSPPARDITQVAAIAEADALVDQGLQSGHWSRQQADELGDAVAHLDLKEQGRILARVSAAINAGELQMDLRR